MERIKGMYGGRSGIFGRHRGEDFVVRSQSREEPYETEAQFHQNKMIVPITTPIYLHDIVERVDPRGGVIEYQVADVDLSRDPFRNGNDHANVTLREKGHADRDYGSVYNFHVSGGANQISTGAGATLNQSVNADRVELAAALKEMLADLPRNALSADQLAELEEAFDEAAKIAGSDSVKPTTVKRSLLGVKGVVEELGSSAKDGANDGLKAWISATVSVLIAKIAGF